MKYQFEPVTPFPEGYYPDFYNRIFENDQQIKAIYPSLGYECNWESIIQQRSGFPQKNRQTLTETLNAQYQGISGEKVLQNIELLAQENTFTVTTGQQIHVFLGPLYVVYKAISTISLAKKLSQDFPDKNFVPVFWMATEDHDKDEIDHITLFGQSYRWETAQTGAVGRFNTEGLSEIIRKIKELANSDTDFLKAIELFEKAYTEQTNFADATRVILHDLFSESGLVVLDADHPELKKLFSSSMQKDLIGGMTKAAMESTSQALKSIGIESAIPAKSGNFFLLNEDSRIRIDRTENGFKLHQSNEEISTAEMESLIDQHPERLSPNVAMRPLYQETILPNLAYIAGPGEIRYWLQLNEVFSTFGIPAPALLPRHSFVITDKKTEQWLDKFGDGIELLWKDEDTLKNSLKVILGTQDSAESEIQKLEVILDEINAKLYKQRNSKLKELKKAGEEYFKNLKKADEGFWESVFTIQENKERLAKLLKYHHHYFDPLNPQERVTDFIQLYLGNSEIISNFYDIPEIGSTCLYIARYRD